MRAYIISNESVKELDIREGFQKDKFYFLVINDSDFEQIGTQFDLMECRTKECLERRQKTGVEIFRHYYFIELNIPKIFEGRIIARQLGIYIGENFFVVSSAEEIELVKKVEEEIQDKHDLVFKGVTNPSNKLLYMIFDRLYIDSLGVVGELERKVEALEEKILKVGRRKVVNEMILLRRQVFRVRRLLNPLTYVIDILLLNELELVDDRMVKYFSNARIKFTQLNNDINSLQHSMESLRETYEAEISNQLNEIMKVFTIISTIFLPLTLITGIYGMNFKYMPELQFKYGYYVVMGFMACVAGVLIMVFRRKKWL